VIFDWLAREGALIFGWWAAVTAAGAAALPICLRFLGGLPDRGFTLARAVGVLLVAFVYWLLASVGFLRNTPGNIILAWMLTLACAIGVYFSVSRQRDSRVDWRDWWRANRAAIITAEALFIALLLAWSIVRAHQNAIVATEKPMEQAFISAVIRSETFPPNDPWMAGYAISYYYFGYVMIGMLALLSGIGSGIAFNLAIALLFALTGLTVFGVVYNLVRARILQTLIARARSGEPDWRRGSGTSVAIGLVGVLFVAVLGNFHTLLIEIPYQTGAASAEYLAFFDTKERGSPRAAPADSLSNWSFWWWFNAARVLNDRNLDGSREEVIDEFPMFSYLLADTHPHVLALPVAALAVGLMLNALQQRSEIGTPEVVFYAICLGGLSFLNTWDGPIYTVGVIGALALRRIIASRDARLRRDDWLRLIAVGVSLFGLSFAFYLPFWVGFRSQLAGALPNLIHPTPVQQFVVHFAPFLLILFPFLLIELRRARDRFNWALAVGGGLGLLGVLIGAMLGLSVLGYQTNRAAVEAIVNQNGGWEVYTQRVIDKRLSHSATAILLTIGVMLVIGRLFPVVRQDDPDTPEDESIMSGVRVSPGTGFALLLAGMGLVLTLAPEFVYLRDNFGTRMNTVFKFYYQAWLLWGIASAYAVFAVLFDASRNQPSAIARAGFVGLVTAAVAGGMVYPILGLHNRMFIETGRQFAEQPAPLTLDGGRTTASPDDYAAVMCLGALVQGDDAVVIAGVGNSYDGGGPPSGLTGRLIGIPVLYNWPGHQGQWRGASLSQVAGTRLQDIERLYTDPTWNSAREILLRYDADYIFYGEFERFRYGTAGEVKFRDRLPIVCEFGNSRFYRIIPEALVE
jgi:YYY domain-containing protein